MALDNGWSVAAALLLLFAGVAGCVSQEDPTLESTQDGAGDGSADGGNETASQTDDKGNASASSPPNPPSVALSVTGDGVETVEDGNDTIYEVAAGANVTFDAAGSTDPAGGNLSFAWDLGNGTTAEGENVTVAFGAGNVTVTVKATSDASGLSAQRSVDVVVTGGAGGVPEPVVITGSAIVPNPVIGAALLCFRDGIDGDIHSIEPAESGWNYVLEPAAGFTVYWWDDSDFLSTGDDAGVVPDGATRAEICQDVSVLGDYTLTLTHPDYVE